MTIDTIDDSQRKAARAVGLSYLLAIPPALFAGVYVFNQLIVRNNVAETALNIIAHERLFRLGIAINLFSFMVDIVLITALYVVLRPVSRGLALFATFVRLIETALLMVVTLNEFNVLRVLSGAEYLRVFEANRLHAFANLSLGAYSAGYNVGLMLAGLGSTVFGYLWFKSDYIPKPLAMLGVFSSIVLATCTFAFIIVPDLANTITLGYFGGPIFVFEVTMGLWLTLKGLRPAAASSR